MAEVIGAVCALVGYAMGWLVGYETARGRHRAEEDERW